MNDSLQYRNERDPGSGVVVTRLIDSDKLEVGDAVLALGDLFSVGRMRWATHPETAWRLQNAP